MSLTPTAFRDALQFALANNGWPDAVVTAPVRLAGGASRESWGVEIAGFTGARTQRCIVRRTRPGDIFPGALSVRQEGSLIEAVRHHDVPVPTVYASLDDVAGAPAIVIEHMRGEGIGRRIVRDPSLAEARRRLPMQMGTALARIHAIGSEGLPDVLPRPTSGDAVATFLVGLTQNVRQLDTPRPAVELALRWLRLHRPRATGDTVLVHGDFRIGNVLVDTDGLCAILDWEFAHCGDRMEDLTWCLIRDWRFGVHQLEFGGISAPEPFFRAYEAESGFTVPRDQVTFWQVAHNVRWALGSRNQAARFLGGQEPDIELAVLGRRTIEMEYEALRLIAAAEHVSFSAFVGDQSGKPAIDAAIGRPADIWALTDPPTNGQLLEAVERFLLDEVAPATTDPRLRYRTLVAAHAIRTAMLASTGEVVDKPVPATASTFPETTEELVEQIRVGRYDAPEKFNAVLTYLLGALHRRMHRTHPRVMESYG